MKGNDYMIEIMYFVHGATDDNISHCSSGWKDSVLNERGVSEASSLFSHIKDEKFDLVVCSDLKRAVQSADIAFKGVDIIYDSRIRECNYGDFNGKSEKFVVYLDHISTRFDNGECLEDVERRVRDLCNELLEKYDGKRIAFMSHRAPQLALEKMTKNITWEQAIKDDWRSKKAWQPGWKYIIKDVM